MSKSKYARQNRYKERKRNIDYNNMIYCIDIETSTQKGTNYKGEKVPCSFMISYAISKLDIETGEISHFSFKRNYTQLQNDLEKIKELSGDKKTLIYIHNFSYEWSFFSNNIPFYKDNITRSLFMKRHKPLLVDCDNLSFRCSYLLLGKSVKTLGHELTAITGENWDKLDYDYQKNRTPLSPISDAEKEYNYKDCDIVLKYIYTKILNTYNIRDLWKKIYTKTGIVRFDNIKHNTTLDYKAFSLFNKDCIPADFEQYSIEQLSFMGGLVSFDFSIIGKTLENIASFDACSDYPYQMLKPFPTKFLKAPHLENIKEFNKFRQDPRYNQHKFWYGIIHVKNLKLNKYNYAILSGHKFFQSVDMEQIFGKVVKAARGVFICTSIDFENYCKFYDFEVTEIDKIYVNRYLNYLPRFTLNSISRLIHAKSELKKYSKMIHDKKELFNSYEFAQEYKYIEDIINEQSDYQIQIALINQYLQEFKSKLKSLYGILVEKSVKETITYNFETMKYEIVPGNFEEFKNSKYVKTNMCVGTFVTAFARRHLIDLLYHLLNNGIQVYYTDTDSLKLDYSDPEKVDKIINEYNDTLYKNEFHIGQFEFEGCYKYFVVNGNKSYISLDNHNNISATIAGLPAASIIYQSLYDALDRDFNKFIEKTFSFNIEVLPEVTDKLTSKYPISIVDEEIEESATQLVHLTIGKYDDYVYTGLILEDCPVTIKGVDTSILNLRSIKNLAEFYDFDLNRCFKKYQIYLKDNKPAVRYMGEIPERTKEMLKKAVKK